MRQKLIDLFLTQFTRVSLFVEKDKSLDPTNVSFFGSEAVVSSADGRTHMVEKFGFPLVRRRGHRIVSAGS